MPKNTGLSNAKTAKKDEFYTTYDDIQKELNYYKDKFSDKTVLCNCDDPYESNFCRFFLKNFNYLGLKRLICTSYSDSPVLGDGQLSLFDDLDEPLVKENAYVFDISEVPMANGRGVSDDDVHNLLTSANRGVKKLKGNGDFRSKECIEYLKQADIVVTNPPFSLFREYVSQLIEYGKNFLIIGNVNAITYKEIFPLIKDNKLWLGASIHSGDRKFYVPADYPLEASGCGIDTDGRKYIRVKGVRWYTNLDYPQRHEKLDLYKRYYGHEDEYPKYDNYDAINVDKTSDIPCDYFEDMGVPITYLDKHNPEQFEIVKFRKGNDDKDLTYTKSTSQFEQNRTEQNRTEQNRTEQNRTEDYSILQDRHQEEDVMESWESRLPSSINTTQINSKSSEMNTSSELKKEEDISMGNECIVESLSRGRCNGIMGVPITFLDKYNPDQFEILGMCENLDLYGLKTHVYSSEECRQRYFELFGKTGVYDLNAAGVINGKKTYQRLLIKRRGIK